VPRIALRDALRREATPRRLAALATGAVTLLVALSLAVWHAFPADRTTTTEAYVYFGFADRVAGGAAPYRDVTVEYPPGALPVFLLPLWLLGDTSGAEWDEAALDPEARRYEAALATLLAGLLAATIAVTAVSLRLLRSSVGHATLALAVLAAAPLLLGALPLTRFDAWPVVLVSVGVLAALAGRRLGAGFALGAAATAKLYPLVLLPGLAAREWRDGGMRPVARLLAGALAAVVLILAPFLAVAPSETVEAVRLQAARGLQMESLGGSLLAAAWKISLSLDNRGLVPGPLPVESCQRCDGLVAAQLTGTLADVVGALALIAVVIGVVVVARRTLRPADPRDGLVWSAATSVTVLVVLGKVLSAQFLLWLLPLVPLVKGRRGLRATALLVVAAVLTNVWFPTLYRDYVNDLAYGPIAVLLLRNGVLLALLVVLLRPEREASDGAPVGSGRGAVP
jgi:hypothetical protein